MKKENYKLLYDIARIGFFHGVFVCLFTAGAFWQVFQFFPQTEYTIMPLNPQATMLSTSTNGDVSKGYSMPYDAELKLKYFYIIKRVAITSIILALLMAFFEYKQDPENHPLNKSWIMKAIKQFKKGGEDD
jgi:hypothetical protein